MDGKRAFMTGNYHRQLAAMDANMVACERNLVNFTLWNYGACNQHDHGDFWNGEDLGLFSLDDGKRKSPQPRSSRKFLHKNPSVSPLNIHTNHINANSSLADLNHGARALEAFVRPYAVRTSGFPTHLSFSYNIPSKRFEYRFESSSTPSSHHPIPTTLDAATTLIFVPFVHFGMPRRSNLNAAVQFDVVCSDGSWSYDESCQMLLHVRDFATTFHSIVITAIH